MLKLTQGYAVGRLRHTANSGSFPFTRFDVRIAGDGHVDRFGAGSRMEPRGRTGVDELDDIPLPPPPPALALSRCALEPHLEMTVQ